MSAGDRHPTGVHDQHLGCGGSPTAAHQPRRQAPCLPAMLALVMERALPWPPPRRAIASSSVTTRVPVRSGGAPTQRPRRGQLATKPRARPGRAPACVAGAMSLCTGSCSKRGVPPAKPTQPRGEAGSKRHNLGFVSDEPPSVSRAVPTPPTRATEGAARAREAPRLGPNWAGRLAACVSISCPPKPMPLSPPPPLTATRASRPYRARRPCSRCGPPSRAARTLPRDAGRRTTSPPPRPAALEPR